MSKNKKNNKFSLSSSSLDRKANNRIEKEVADEKPLMLFSFKDFNRNQGQTFDSWQEEKLLAYAVEKFGYICQKNIFEAEQEGYIKVYRDKSKIDDFGFPKNSAFTNPFPNSVLDWAVIMNIKGQKRRIAGHIIGNIFYVVFLDAEHQFFPSEKKNT